MVRNLDSPDRIAKYLTEAFETADSFFIASAIGDAARAQGMTAIAKKARVERAALYRSFNGERRAEFDTIMRVLTALNIKLTAKRWPTDLPPVVQKPRKRRSR